MPMIVLSNAQRATVSVKKSQITKKHNKKEYIRHRVTAKMTVFLPLKENEKRSEIEFSFTADATCSETDSFNPRYGRQEAVRRLLKIIGGRITKEDRKAVVTTLCPEFFLSKTDRLRNQYERLKEIFEPKIKVEEKVA